MSDLAPPASTIMGRTQLVQPLHYNSVLQRWIGSRNPSSPCNLATTIGHTFHVLANDGSEALVGLASLRVISGSIRPAVLKEALAWASQNMALLATKWKELNP